MRRVIARSVSLALVTSAVLAAAPALARTDICYGGGLSLPNFTLNGNATLSSATNDILINEAINTQVGTVFYNAPFNTAGDLHVRFKINISKPGAGGADGMTFIMTSDATGAKSIGLPGGGIGYQGITPSVVLEFDTYTNPGDPNNNHMGLTLNGDPVHTSAQNAGLPVVNLSTLVPPIQLNAQPLNIWIDYTGSSSRLQVYLSTTAVKPLIAAMDTTKVDFKSVLGSSFYMGFSGSTGGSNEQNEIVELYASDVGQPGDACCTPPAGTECTLPPGSTVGPVCDSVKKVCGPCTLGSVSSCPANQKACDVSGGDNVCTAPCGGDFGSGKANACPSQNFPVCSTSGSTAGSCVTCNGDNGTGATKPCAAGAPTCLATGYCGLCSQNSDCTTGANHAGPLCNQTTGVCDNKGTPCTTDSQCGSANWCNAGSCTAKLTNGTPIPTVAGHTPTLDGKCTTTEAGVVCQSSVCDTKDNACGYANGDGITGASALNKTPTADCRSGAVSPTDGLCGLANGNLGCNTANAGSVCRSGACSAIGVCIPAGGCAADSDCTSAQFCNTTTAACTTKLANGATIPVIPQHNPALNGMCTTAAGTSVCQSGVCDTKNNECGYANGDGIPSASKANPTPVGDCQSAAVDTNDGLCGFADGDGTCSLLTGPVVCRSGVCGANGVCRSATGCNVDADCTAGLWCNETAHTCNAKLANGQPLPTDAAHTNPTLDGKCSTDAAKLVCVSSVCDTKNSECGYANGDGIPSASKANPTPVTDCQSAVVDTNDGLCGFADNDGTCTDATAATVCRSGFCSVSGVCRPATGCDVDGDCTAGSWCNETAHTCTLKLDNGKPLPTDAAHTNPTLDGKCSDQAGALVCSSGVCDAKNSECGYANGDGIPSASKANPTPVGDCQSAVVDTNDGLCGLADGDGLCTALTGATVCRSGFCSVGGTCVAAGACNVDGDCTAGSWCNETAHACTPVLANGQPLPTDAAHTNPTLDGKCSDQAGALVCSSGVCDAKNSECGYANGDGIPSASKANPTPVGDCQSAVVDTNDGLCGFADGDGTCTDVTGASVCRSGSCSKAGVCAAPGKCVVDGDCTSTQFCDTSSSTCTSKLTNNTPVPTITGHTPALTGACSPDVGTAVCQSGVCDAKDNACGYADGDGTCTADSASTVCRSGGCSKTGVCEAVGKCLADVDCASTQFCNTETSLCGDKLANGTKVPTLKGHTPALSGTCSPDVGTSVCSSGVCDTKDNECGLADGDGPCSTGDVCRSGSCTNGLCGPSGSGGSAGSSGSAGATSTGGNAGKGGSAGTGGTGGKGGTGGVSGSSGQGGAGGSGAAGQGGAGAGGAAGSTSGSGPVEPTIGFDLDGDGACQVSSTGASTSGTFALGGLLALAGMRRRRRVA